MALNEATIKAGVKDAFTAVMNQEEDREGALDKLSSQIAKTIVAAIKSAEVTYVSGLVAPPSGGPVTGKLIHTIV